MSDLEYVQLQRFLEYKHAELGAAHWLMDLTKLCVAK